MRADGKELNVRRRPGADSRVACMPVAIQLQLRSRRARLPAVPLDIHPRDAVGDVPRRLREEILKNNLRRYVHAWDCGQQYNREPSAQELTGYLSHSKTAECMPVTVG